MAHKNYSEDHNIQQPTAEIFEQELGWRSVYAFNAETFGPDSLLGRSDASEVVLVRELDAALARINPGLAATPAGRTQLTLASRAVMEDQHYQALKALRALLPREERLFAAGRA